MYTCEGVSGYLHSCLSWMIQDNGFISPRGQTFDSGVLKVFRGERRVLQRNREAFFHSFSLVAFCGRESCWDLLTRGNFHSEWPDPRRLGRNEEWLARRQRRRHRHGTSVAHVAMVPPLFFLPLFLFPSRQKKEGVAEEEEEQEVDPADLGELPCPEYSFAAPATGFMAGIQDLLIVLNRPHTVVLSRVCCRLINVLITPAIGYQEAVITSAGLAGRTLTGTPTARMGHRGRAQGAICECHWRLKYVSHLQLRRVQLPIWLPSS